METTLRAQKKNPVWVENLLKWTRATRPESFGATIVPVMLGSLLALGGVDVEWGLVPFILLSALALHAGTNLVNDYYDYDLGVDNEFSLGGSGLLVSGELTAKQIGRAAIAAFGLAAYLGTPLIILRGWPIVMLGLVGIAGGALYTAKPVQYKYWGAGDILVFLLMGPLMVGGTHFALTGEWSLTPWLVSLPVGLLVTAILHANNLRDLELDAEFELKTFAIRLGRARSVKYLDALLIGAFVLIVALAATGFVPWFSLLALLMAPAARKLSVWAHAAEPGQAEPDILKQSGIVHLGVGLLLCAGIALAQLF